MDAAHFVWGGFVGFLWCITKIWFRSPSGRQRFNILGALNAVTHEMITVSNETYINAWSVVELLFKLRKRFLMTGIPITIFLDNAAYQTSYLVKGAAHLMGIELIYLPPYSPNLNLIERMWKFVKRKVLYPKVYETFSDFSNAIEDCLSEAHTSHKEELDSLLTWNFQTLPIVNEEQVLKRAA